VESSISIGLEVSIWYLNWFSIFSFISPRFFGVNNFESFAPQFFMICSSFASIKTPAKIIGPRTGPLPASSIPINFVMLCIEEKAL